MVVPGIARACCLVTQALELRASVTLWAFMGTVDSYSGIKALLVLSNTFGVQQLGTRANRGGS